HPACVGSHKKRGFLLRDRRLESTTHARTALSRDLGRDMDGRFAVARRYYDLPRKSSATSSVRRNALKRSFNSLATSRLQPFLPSRWKYDWQTATRSTSQIMRCCHQPWWVWRT